jgi:hypothetical protein
LDDGIVDTLVSVRARTAFRIQLPSQAFRRREPMTSGITRQDKRSFSSCGGIEAISFDSGCDWTGYKADPAQVAGAGSMTR